MKENKNLNIILYKILKVIEYQFKKMDKKAI